MVFIVAVAVYGIAPIGSSETEYTDAVRYCFSSLCGLFFNNINFCCEKVISDYRITIYMSRLMGKPTICIGENKDADQLRGNREADQRLCFRYSDSTIPPLLNSKISSFWSASVAVQTGLCQTCSETTLLVFPRDGSYIIMPPTLKKLEGHIAFGLSVCLSVRV